tara:strand:- start:197 stop:1159 length:963 start_codon:yes stop_codon:yes gene_type:complete
MNDLGLHVDAFTALPGWRGEVPEGCIANFLGVMTDEAFVALHAPSNHVVTRDSDGLASVPNVSDGETFFEFAAIYAAVKAAQGQFTMVELGGGYASRCVDAHAALQRFNPMPSNFVVVEAEPVHFDWAKRHMRANGIDPDQHWMINAAVSDSHDPVLFLIGEGLYYNSIIDHADASEMCRQVEGMDKTLTVLRNLMCTGQLGIDVPYTSQAGDHMHDMKYVSARPLSDILKPLATVDLLDIDIQGAEISVLPPAMGVLNDKVKRVHLGTHGAEIHSFMWDMFFEAEWLCEFDYPPNTDVETEWGSFRTSDGILTFANMRF